MLPSGADNEPGGAPPPAKRARREEGLEKPKTVMDVSYDIMRAEKEAEGASKGDIYDAWVDMKLEAKLKYVDLAKQKIQGMTMDELAGVQLTRSEISELGLQSKCGVNDLVEIAPASSNNAGNVYLGDDTDDKANDIKRDNSGDEGNCTDDMDDDGIGGGGGGYFRMGGTHRSAVSLQSLNTSSVLDEDEAVDEFPDTDGLAHDESYQEQHIPNFLKVVGSDKYKPPTVGLQYQAMVEPWLNAKDRVADDPERNHSEREIAYQGNSWSLNDDDDDDEDRTELTSSYLKEAFAILKNTMYSKLVETTAKRVKLPRNVPVGLSPIVDGTIMYLQPDCYENLLQLLRNFSYKADAALSFLKQQCLANDATYIMSWNHSEQERANAGFAKSNGDVLRLMSMVPSKRRAEVVDYYVRFIEAGRHLESECSLDSFLRQAETEVAALKRGETVQQVLNKTSSNTSTIAMIGASESGIANETTLPSLSNAAESESDVKVEASLPRKDGDVHDEENGGFGSIQSLEVHTVMDSLHKFEIPESLMSSIPPQLHESTKNIAIDALEFAKNHVKEYPMSRSARLDRLSRFQEEERRDNFALTHLQKMKTVAFMLKAKRTLDDVCFTFLMNSLSEYRHFTLSPAELIVRVRSICNFSRNDPFSARNDTSSTVGGSPALAEGNSFESLFHSFLEFMPRPIELLLTR